MDDSCNGGAQNEKQSKRDVAAENHLKKIMKEKQGLDHEEYPVATRLLDEELKKTESTGKAAFDDRYIDLYNERPTKLVAKIMFPSKEHPTFNFVGKLLGPKGITLKTLQENTRCKMAILGRGSMKDKAKEEEYRTSNDPKYLHLNEQLHVEVSCVAPPSEAYHRIGCALQEVQEWLQPDPPADEGFYGFGGEEMRPRGPPRPMMGGRMGGNMNAKAMDFLEKARAAMDFQPPPRPPRPFAPQRGGFEGAGRGGGGGGGWMQGGGGGGFKRGGGGGGGPRKDFYPPRNAPYQRH